MDTMEQFTLFAFIASALTFSLPDDSQAMPVRNGVKNVVLVHGAFADGSSWAKVVSLLQDCGFNTIAVQNPLTSLEDDVEATRRAIALMDGPVLLVGHSWGGMVITEAGNDPKVVGLVYVSALIPDEGQSVVDVIQAFPPAPGSAEFQEDTSGFLSLSLKGIHEDFAQDLPPSARRVLFATQVPWAKGALIQKVSNIAWKTKPSWVIISSEDRMINPELERAEAKMIHATTLEINSNHVPMISDSRKVANFITEAAEHLSIP